MAWLHGGNDPYRLFNALDEECRPLGHPEADPYPPAFPTRVKTFIYACGQFANEQEHQKLKVIAGSRVG